MDEYVVKLGEEEEFFALADIEVYEDGDNPTI